MKRVFYDENVYPELGEKLKERRKLLRLSQEYVSNQLGCKRYVYYLIEHGSSLALRYADKLRKILGDEPFSVFPYDIFKYSRQKLAIYSVLFGVSEEEIAKTFNASVRHIQAYLRSDEPGYPIHLKDKWDALFPHMDMIQDVKKLGKSSVEVILNGERYILVNQIKSRPLKNDTVWDLIEELRKDNTTINNPGEKEPPEGLDAAEADSDCTGQSESEGQPEIEENPAEENS